VPLLLCAAFGLAACAPEYPGESVGMTDYGGYGAPDPRGAAPLPAGGAAPVTGFDPARVGAAIDAADPQAAAPAPLIAPVPQGGAYGAVIGTAPAAAPLDPFDPNRPRGDAPSTIAVQTGELAHMEPSSTGISDEQDFNAVSARETIESDAERLARNRAQYTVIQPTALPPRTEDGGPNIVAFAVNTRNQPGEPLYSRSAIRLTSPEAACRRFRSPDLAQEAFLEAGGPERDPRGLDPDGDGFACDWDPRPFRTALQ
jgi:hypothetical protein